MNSYLELLIRASLLILTGLLLWGLAKNRSAESRVTLLRLTVLGLAILPAVWALGPRWNFDIPGMAKPDPVLINFDLDVLNYATSLPEPSRVDMLPLVYLGIALLVLVPAVVGHFVLQKIWRKAMPLGWRLEDELSEALDTVGVKQIVEGRKGPISSPFVFGVVRRFILLPASFEDWPEEHRRSALLHEAAHLKRFDCAWQHLAHGVRAVYWCHPLVWFLSRALKDETELAADERAIRSGAEAADYASALVAIARTLQEPGRLVRSQGVTFMNHRQLDRRVRSVLHGRRRGFTSIGGLIMVAMAAIGTYLTAGANPQKPQADVISVPGVPLTLQEVPVAGMPVQVTQPQEIRIVSGKATAKSQIVTVAPREQAAKAVASRVITTKELTGKAVPGVVIAPTEIRAATTQGRAVRGTVVAPSAVEVQGVPVLKNLPIIGKLFQTQAAPVEGRVVGTTESFPKQNRDPLSVAVAAPASRQGEPIPALNTTVAHRASGTQAIAAPVAMQGRYGVATTVAPNAFNPLMLGQGKLNEADLARALELLSKLEGDHKRDVAELRRLLAGASQYRKAAKLNEFFRMGHEQNQANAFRNKFQQEWARDQFNQVQKPENRGADDAKKPADWKVSPFTTKTWVAPSATAPITTRRWVAPATDGKALGTFSQDSKYKVDLQSNPLTRYYNVATGGTKPVVVKISVDGKMHELNATPDKDGIVRIEVDANGKVRVVGGK